MGDFAGPGIKGMSSEGSPPFSGREDVQKGASAHLPFHAQFDHLSKPQQLPQITTQHGLGSFDMGTMAGSLPQSIQRAQPHYSHEVNVFSPASVYQMHHASSYPPLRTHHVDPQSSRMQQQHYMAAQFNAGPHQQQGLGPHPGQYPRMDMFQYGMPPQQYSPVGTQFGAQAMSGFGASMANSMTYYQQRHPEPAPIPNYPRGPPRKPKQSGYALWVGNLPPAATVSDLKDHFSRDATKDIESLFLISKSNCAFVNYRTEAACAAAMNRFHDSRFHGIRLVCRLRRGSASSVTTPTVTAPSEAPTAPARLPLPIDEPTIVGGSQAGPSFPAANAELAAETGAASQPEHKVPEKFFIVKSLTVQDLEASVRNGTWATQSHNEDALNAAYKEADNVYLVFSANKSGEYFGYARMTSGISGEPVSLSSIMSTEEPAAAGTPHAIPTSATETAPKGRIIDDSARGTIFWEAEQSEDDGSESPTKEAGDEDMSQAWGRQFKIEWIATSRLPFYRTRGLRNPWNANREVKIARDGTELEPSVGSRLLQMFHRPSPSHAGAPPY